MVQMVGLDVGDEHGGGREVRERLVALVGLHHVPPATAGMGVRAVGAHDASDEERGVLAQRVQVLASMDDVVVLPCVPATASASSSSPRRASILARCQMRSPRSCAAISSGLFGRMAVDTTTVGSPSGTFSAAWPMATGMPASFSCLV